jgi:hypothetical protein
MIRHLASLTAFVTNEAHHAGRLDLGEAPRQLEQRRDPAAVVVRGRAWRRRSLARKRPWRFLEKVE